MLNVNIGVLWNENQFVEKLGPFSKTDSELNHHDAYYFEKADMTIIVSRIKNTVATWRMGPGNEVSNRKNASAASVRANRASCRVAVRDGSLEVQVTNAAKRMNV